MAGDWRGDTKRYEERRTQGPNTSIVSCAGCGKSIGRRGSPPMRNMGVFGTIHDSPDCARKATAAHYEAEKSDEPTRGE